MLKKFSYLLLAPAFLLSCGGAEADTDTTKTDSTAQVAEETIEEVEETPKPVKSPRVETTGMANGVQIDLAYGSPFVKERAIWGDLVPFDKIWRAGANDATAITFGQDVMIDGSEVAAGTYALFIIPQENADWTIVLNEEWSKELHGVWGAYDHKPEKDVLRFDVTPTYGEAVTESLMFGVTETGVKFAWEKAMFSFDVMAKG